MRVEADAVLEEGAGVVWEGLVSQDIIHMPPTIGGGGKSAENQKLTNNSVDTAELLETLDGAGDEQSPLRLNAVVLQEVLPRAGAHGRLNGHGLDDDAVHAAHLHVVRGGGLDPSQDLEALVGTVVGCQPAGGLGNPVDDEEHGDDAEALQDDGHSPGVAPRVGGEGVVDPVDQEDTEVEGRELGTDVLREKEGGLAPVHQVRRNRLHRLRYRYLQTPLLDLGLNSACKTGTVELMMPMPTPDTMRPTMSWARPNADACRMAPTIMIQAPMVIDRRRPSFSPKTAEKIEPKKHPTE